MKGYELSFTGEEINERLRKIGNIRELVIDEIKDNIRFGLHTDGYLYLFINDIPMGNGVKLPSGASGDIVGNIDSDNNIVLMGVIPDGNYTIKYEMEDGSLIDIGNLELDNTQYYSITNELTNCVNSNTAVSIVKGEAYSAKITANSGYELDSVVVTMGGQNVAVSGGVINISSVTGNIVITAVAIESSGEQTGGNRSVPAEWSEPDHRLSAGNGTVTDTEGTGHIVTNFILAEKGDTLRVKGLAINQLITNYNRAHTICTYKSNKEFESSIYTGHSVSPASYNYAKSKVAVTGDISTYTLIADDTGGNRATDETAYIRISGSLMSGYEPADVVITINEEIPLTYTNQIPKSTDNNDELFNEKGYKTGYRLSYSKGEVALDGYTITGFIPVNKASTLYIKNIEFQKHDYQIILGYDINKKLLTTTDTGIPLADLFVTSLDGNVYSSKAFTQFTHTNTDELAYIRICAAKIDDYSILTVDEEII